MADAPVTEFLFDIVSDTIALSIDEIWPDGDAPENPTAEDVAAVMRVGGTSTRVLHDWSLDSYINVDVSTARGNAVRVW